jgi:hypothetical protein
VNTTLSFARFLLALILALALADHASAQINIHLSQESEQSFAGYVSAAEAKMDWRARFRPKPNGEIIIAAGGTQPNAEPTIDVKDALIHDWVAATFVPGATLEKTLAVLQSYDDYKTIYAPHITNSKLLEHHGDGWRVYLRLNKTKGLVFAVLDTEYEVEYRPLAAAPRGESEPGATTGGSRWMMLSRSTKINEIQFGKTEPAGYGVGFLWNLNAYWVIEKRPGGVYLECRSISMSRDIPTGTGWVIKPIVTSLPRESLRDTMTLTAKAIMR